MISQRTFYIPPEIEVGLRSGDLIQYGGIVRNRLGQIVMHLKEVGLPANSEKAVARVATILKNPRYPRIIITAAVVGTVAAGVAMAITVARKRKQTGTPEVPECVKSYNTSLRTYVEAVHEGRLDVDIINQFIADFDAVKAHSDENGSITLDLSTKHAEMLVNIVVGYTRQLVKDNAVDLNELQDQAPVSENDGVFDLRRHLEVQRKIFTEAV
ncbi:hypothetical protein [Streptomyces sp. NPDC018352]|uniref:hypothetical protein n=1 Tax=Streptomyces sp. NPDC018352 TaxID=3157194 RepID=UPI0033CBF521